MSKEAIEALERALEKERMDGSPENCRATNKALTSLRSSPPPPSELVEAGEAIPKEEASIALWSLRGTLENIRFNIRHYESMTEADIDLMDRGKTLQDLRRDEDGLTKSIALISRAKSSQPSPNLKHHLGVMTSTSDDDFNQLVGIVCDRLLGSTVYTVFMSEKMNQVVRRIHAQPSQWISVETRLPEPYTWVLVFSDTSETGDFQFDIGRVIGGEWKCLGWDYPVTHWMPLPPTPEQR